MITDVPVCVPPIAVTEAILTSTDVPEADYSVITDSTGYVLEDRVISTSTHKIYECILAYTSAATAIPPNLDPTHWVEVSATNRWKVFDTVNSSQTAQATSMNYTLSMGEAINTLGVLNLTNATEIRVQLVDDTFGTVYDRTVDVSNVPTANGWWEWWFGLRRAPIDAVFTDIPAYPDASLIIDIMGGDDLAVGTIIIGQAVQLGSGFEFGASVGIQDYSKVQENDFGDTVLIQRAFAKRATFPIYTAKEDFDAVVSFIATQRAKPCLWIGSVEYESTFIYGFYQDFGGTISYPTYSEISLQLRGLT